jgi:hypothetical protein
LQISEDVSDRDGVRNVRLTAEPFLSFVCLGAELVRVADTIDLCGGKIGFELIEKLRDPNRTSSSGEQTQNGRRVVHRTS